MLTVCTELDDDDDDDDDDHCVLNCLSRDWLMTCGITEQSSVCLPEWRAEMD